MAVLSIHTSLEIGFSGDRNREDGAYMEKHTTPHKLKPR